MVLAVLLGLVVLAYLARNVVEDLDWDHPLNFLGYIPTLLLGDRVVLDLLVGLLVLSIIPSLLIGATLLVQFGSHLLLSGCWT